MTPSDLSALNHEFGIPGRLRFAQCEGGLAVAEISNEQAKAAIFLQGAHLARWTPHGQEPVIWISKAAQFAEGRSIRGGIPICWPWFGPHASETSFPSHGFARTSPWEVTETAELDSGATYLALRLPTHNTPSIGWPYATPVEVRFTVGKRLEIELRTRNLEPSPLIISQALHTYFRVGDIRRVRILGLDGCPFLDKVDGGRRKKQEGPLTIGSEVDRIYLNSTLDCLIDDPSLNRRIRIEKQGSASTIVWNPWEKKASTLGDMSEDGYLEMVCVESANAAEDVVRIVPGGEHRLWVKYGLEALDSLWPGIRGRS